MVNIHTTLLSYNEEEFVKGKEGDIMGVLKKMNFKIHKDPDILIIPTNIQFPNQNIEFQQLNRDFIDLRQRGNYLLINLKKDEEEKKNINT